MIVDSSLLTAPQNGHTVEKSNSPNSIVTLDSSNWSTTNEKTTALLTKLVRNVTSHKLKSIKTA